MKRLFLLLVVVLLPVSVSFAGEIESCKTIHYKPSQVYVVRASLHKASHIILPEPILGKPINGNVNLWTVEGANNHLFIKPTSLEKDGSETTVTVIGVSNVSYDFIARRVTTDPDYCINVVNDGQLIKGHEISQWQPPETGQIAALKAQLTAMQANLKKQQAQAREQVEEAMLSYRGHIYTRYEWTEGGGGFMNKDVVSDVWDDGRWTYIRVANDNKGVLTVTGVIDGRKELIEYQYDREGKIYKIVGIYPELELRYDETEITVKRQDATTAGAY
jgi:hypothetical protein